MSHGGFVRVVRIYEIVLLAVLLTGVLGAGTALLPACGSSGSTRGARIALATKIRASSGISMPFVNSAGWRITLSSAWLSTGALRYYEGATIFSQRRTPVKARPFDDWKDFFTIRSAFAHPGHYVPGTVRGEYLAPSSVDLRIPTPLGVGDGVSGVVRSATFSFQSPPTGPFADALGGHVAVLEGEATLNGAHHLFRAEIDADDLLGEDGALAVEGCPFDETDMGSDGVVTVTIAIEQWFDRVEFGTMPESTDSNRVTMPVDSLARHELVRGMKSGLGYRFTYRTSAPNVDG